MAANVDPRTVEGFGYEWSQYDQSSVPSGELHQIFEEYFSLFPWQQLPPSAIGFDVGCGSGRWARLVAPRVGRLHCVDASAEALSVARGNLSGLSNCELHHASVGELPFADGSMDFGYSLGVLHHVPDTAGAIAACTAKLKPGAPLLLYLYYALDNRPLPYRLLWKVSDRVRRTVSALPYPAKKAVSELVAATVYWPLSRFAAVASATGRDVSGIPLAFYRDKSYQTLRTDAFDRFATRLEQRFTREQITQMMEDAGLERVKFREGAPYWCAIGFRRP